MSRPPEPIAPAQLHWDERGQPHSSHYQDAYFSHQNGLAETRYVFLEPNRLAARFSALTAPAGAPPPQFTLAETGFGTGLNFLATWQLWRQRAPARAHLHFISVEKHPLSAADLQQTLALWPELAELAIQLQKQYPVITGCGFHRLRFADNVSLTLIIDDAAQGLEHLLPSTDPRWRGRGTSVDAWFLDGFTPAKNPAMWSDKLFAVVGLLSHKGTTAATFSAAKVVKDGLQNAGFSVTKTRGFGGKRNMLHARASTPNHQPSALKGAPAHGVFQCGQRPTEARAIIVGAGLAGCHSARALAERGWQVHVIERAQVASAGSGNRQGLLYTKLGHRRETLPLFNLAALQFSQRHYQDFWHSRPQDGAACGVLQLATSAAKTEQHSAIYQSLGQPGALVRPVSADEASELSGITLDSGGLFFPHSGWISPPVLCEYLLDHPNIRVSAGQTLARLHPLNDERHTQWQALDSTGGIIASAPVAIVACAQSATELTQLRTLPLKAIRGQVTYLPATANSSALKTALCSRGYLAPAHKGQHSLGATFNLGVTHRQIDPEDHRRNLAHLSDLGGLQRLFPAQINSDKLDGRAAFRCATPDYLPIVGPVPHYPKLAQDFTPLARNAKTPIATELSYHSGLYINVGHGSRGLAYTPLCAELLAGLINGEPLALPRPLAQALHPARFALRDIIRGRKF